MTNFKKYNIEEDRNDDRSNIELIKNDKERNDEKSKKIAETMSSCSP
jgi:hypothetical protein